MKLSDKYKIEEDTMNLALSKRVIVQKEGSKNKGKARWDVLGYYSTSVAGRVQIYHKLCNLEISDLEKQGLQEILDTVKEVGGGIREFLLDQLKESGQVK